MRSAWRSRNGPASRPTRSLAWRRTSASPAPRRARRRCSAASRPGRTGSSNGPTPPARRERCAATARASARTTTGSGSDMTSTPDTHPDVAPDRGPAGLDVADTGSVTLHGDAPDPSGPLSEIDYSERIPNNVNLVSDRKLQRALERWQPKFLDWWQNLGPSIPTQDVYLRTATAVGRDGWAHFDHVPMEQYRWGIFLAERDPDRTIAFGAHKGDPAWQEVPGEYRADLRRLIVVQGDTEPASVEQQRHLGNTARSLYDMRNLFQVNVEEGRHLWAMVYLLHAYFGRDGREEAEELLARHSGDTDKPRILGTFNEPIGDWLSFFMFTYFTDRDGRFQLKSLAQSGFDPLSRTCRFMLTEEAHHMFVGETGVGRIVKRTLEVMKEIGSDDAQAVRNHGAVDLATIQRYMNFWFTSSLDLFGSEVSSNAASSFASGIKGRPDETQYEDHVCSDAVIALETPQGQESVSLRNAMN